jgi:hypothetical protein
LVSPPQKSSQKPPQDRQQFLHRLFRPQFAIRHERGVEGAVLGPVRLGRNLRDDLGEDGLGGGNIGMQVADDGFGGDGLFLDQAISEAFSKITAKDAAGYFASCCYSII